MPLAPAEPCSARAQYGVIVNQIGMQTCMDDLQMKYLLPLSRLLFPKQGSSFSAHHSLKGVVEDLWGPCPALMRLSRSFRTQLQQRPLLTSPSQRRSPPQRLAGTLIS